ncbi:uncharacterized protein LOC105829264 isoform X2 [Monomorium pharaonis]|uniref:uncharacterized protein LOC105829264 isoform X2 n=1 Tax=Monomorium pharaonis TaxID=307658 RepID=UPI0017468A44|nr:uncharacterized protein LOC105829264 isoform X2 [Monomorium pharaonis]
MCCLFIYFVTLSYIPLKVSIHFVKHLIGYVSLSANVIVAYSSQKHFIKFFDRLDSYDHEAARMKIRRRDKLWIPWIIAFLMALVSLWLIITIMYITKVDDAFLSSLSDIYTMIIHMCDFLEKFLLLYLVLERLKHLNEKIAPNVSWDEERREPNAIRISDIKVMHLMLYDAHVAFNNVYRNSLFLSFGSLMMRVVANLSIFRKENALIASSFVGPPIMLMLLICIICHRTMEEANNIVCVLNKTMITLVNSGKTMAKISTLTYFLHNCVSFDAAGFFRINLPLFHSVSVIPYFELIKLINY